MNVNRNVIASHCISSRLAGGLAKLVRLIGLNEASMPNFNFLQSLEVAQKFGFKVTTVSNFKSELH